MREGPLLPGSCLLQVYIGAPDDASVSSGRNSGPASPAEEASRVSFLFGRGNPKHFDLKSVELELKVETP